MEIPKDNIHIKPNLFEQMRVNAWKCFLMQYEENKMCDVMIKCGSRKFYSHRCILSAVSPYFKVMFSSEYSQNKDDGYFVSDLSDFPPNCVHYLLDFIYQKGDMDTSLLDILGFLKLLDYLQIKDLYDVIEKVARQDMDLSNSFKVLEVADICRMSELAQVTLAFITSNIKEIVPIVDFSNVPQHVILLCLHSEIFQYVDVKDAMSLIATWVQAKYIERESVQKLLEIELHDNWQSHNVEDRIAKTRYDLVLHYSTTRYHYLERDLVKVNSDEN